MAYPGSHDQSGNGEEAGRFLGSQPELRARVAASAKLGFLPVTDPDVMADNRAKLKLAGVPDSVSAALSGEELDKWRVQIAQGYIWDPDTQTLERPDFGYDDHASRCRYC